MIKTLFVFLLSLYTVNVFASGGGYIGTKDDRSYGSLSDGEYRGIVKLSIDGNRCTGGFISKNLILTNDHCAVYCKNGCVAEFWNGSGYEKSNLRIVAYYEKYDLLSGNDWAILLSDKDSNFYKPVSPTSAPGQVMRGGFGALRIIEDSEIPFLKSLYAQTVKEFNVECKKQQKQSFPECINDHVDKKLKEMGKKPLLEDASNFKVQTCKILGTHPQSPRMVKTDCDSSGGDSGAPLLRSGQIVGLNNCGRQGIFGDSDANAVAVKTENFYDYAQKYIKKYEHTSTPSGNNDTKPSNQQSQNDNSNTSNQQPKNNNSNNSNTTNQKQNNTDNNTGNNQSQPNIYDDPQQIQQILQQKIQDFDCE